MRRHLPCQAWFVFPSKLLARKRLQVLRTTETPRIDQMSLSRLNHRLPRGQTHPEVMQGTAEFHHEIADAILPV
jgi:hypothetical protein